MRCELYPSNKGWILATLEKQGKFLKNFAHRSYSPDERLWIDSNGKNGN